MKKYNVKNYIRYKLDLTDSIHSIELKELKEYTREELIVMFLPLVENIGRKFATSQQASGVMSINDLIECVFEHEESINKAMRCKSKKEAMKLMAKLKNYESMDGYNLWMSDENGMPPLEVLKNDLYLMPAKFYKSNFSFVWQR